MTHYHDHAEDQKIQELKNFTLSLSPTNILPTRANLNRLLNGNVFYPIYTWPLKIQLLYTNTPLSDQNTFKILVFMYGNGCPPETLLKYLCTSYYYGIDKLPKRLYQIKWILKNFTSKSHAWYYFDIHNQEILYNTRT